MKRFEYTIKAADGIHARPAGILVNKALKYKCSISMKYGDKEANVKKLFALMKLGVKQNDKISLFFDGEDEEDAYAEITANIGENY
ncbi:HPr family phosphocarrier protein [Treponema brennaborense]|uniref:Phosphotransferase system, phosphocarrier protein HPr n=1 Tax=Treponema brennaborense (strain DSM 12168 / CIP 105900 / DD5/3) TaxID=906968 RepID=F4LLZ7_TREBD|nr:HPr family phosphocarrier protein [Treponema brennaborense]AEE15689.1 Phosphotransferase system, phosphocarrier protein HPr [Treponema brennaborense DSM 12168]